MYSFNGKIGDFMVVARYQSMDNQLVWNAVLYREGNPVSSIAGRKTLDASINPAAFVETEIAAIIKAKFS